MLQANEEALLNFANMLKSAIRIHWSQNKYFAVRKKNLKAKKEDRFSNQFP